MPLGIDATSFVNRRLVNEQPSIRAIVGARIMAAVARNLAFVHGAGFTHGDVKPANVIIVREWPMETRLIDWNLARMANASTATVSTLYDEALEALGVSSSLKRAYGIEEDVYRHVKGHTVSELRYALECDGLHAQRRYVRTEPYAFFPLPDLADIMAERVMATPNVGADEWPAIFACFRDIYSLAISYLLVIATTNERNQLYDEVLQSEKRPNQDSSALRAFVAEHCTMTEHMSRDIVLDMLSANVACLQSPSALLAHATRALDECGALTTTPPPR